MGEDQDLKKYKKKYLSALEKVIKDIVDYSKGEEVKTFNSEKDFVLSMLAVIKGEEEVVSDILETLH